MWRYAGPPPARSSSRRGLPAWFGRSGSRSSRPRPRRGNRPGRTSSVPSGGRPARATFPPSHAVGAGPAIGAAEEAEPPTATERLMTTGFFRITARTTTTVATRTKRPTPTRRTMFDGSPPSDSEGVEGSAVRGAPSGAGAARPSRGVRERRCHGGLYGRGRRWRGRTRVLRRGGERRERRQGRNRVAATGAPPEDCEAPEAGSAANEQRTEPPPQTPRTVAAGFRPSGSVRFDACS